MKEPSLFNRKYRGLQVLMYSPEPGQGAGRVVRAGGPVSQPPARAPRQEDG